MILQALVQLAENEKLIADPDFEFKPVAWIVRLREDGTVIAIEENRRNLNEGQIDKKGKPIKAKWVGNEVLIPLFPTGRAGIKPKASFLVDMVKFIFGREPLEESNDGSLLPYVERFRQLVADCETATDDPSVSAVRKMLDRVIAGESVATLSDEVGPSDLFMFRVANDDIPVHARPAVHTYWKQLRAAPPADVDPNESTMCLVSGVPIIGKPPLFPLIKGVPGAGTMGSGLLPFNGPSSRTWSSFGLEGNENAPVSRLAAEAAATALNRLADPRPTNGKGEPLPVRRIRLSSDTIVVYWSSDPAPAVLSVVDALPNLLDPINTTADVGNLIGSYRTGAFKPLQTPARFYAITLTGTTGRIIVRDWFETSVNGMQANLVAYFAALELGNRGGGLNSNDRLSWQRKTPPSFRAIYNAISTPKKSSSSGPDPVASAAMTELWRIIIHPAAKLKESIPAKALSRAKASLNKGEEFHSAAISLLKLFLVRNGDKDMTVALNKLHPNAAYHCGRLMAAVAEVQRASRRRNKSDRSNDATVIRRFFGAAMVSPGLYFGRLLAMTEKAHLPKIPRKRANFYRDTIGGIMSAVPQSLPGTLSLKDQSFFTLGFYHQQSTFRSLPQFKYMTSTKQGDWVCSTGEKAVANALTELGHRWWHETTVNVQRRLDDRTVTGWRSPDFLIRPELPKSRGFIEVLGMLEHQSYGDDWEAKKDEYRSVGILPYNESGASPNGKLYWINTSPTSTDSKQTPSFRDGNEQLDELKIKIQLSDWFGNQVQISENDSDETEENQEEN